MSRFHVTSWTEASVRTDDAIEVRAGSRQAARRAVALFDHLQQVLQLALRINSWIFGDLQAFGRICGAVDLEDAMPRVALVGCDDVEALFACSSRNSKREEDVDGPSSFRTCRLYGVERCSTKGRG